MKMQKSIMLFILMLPLTSANPGKLYETVDVWFSPNLGTEDYLELFMSPSDKLWLQATQKIDVFMFHGGNLNDPVPGATYVNGNTFSAFAELDAFRKLGDWDIDIGAEVAVFKKLGDGTPMSCNSSSHEPPYWAFRDAVIEKAKNIYNSGGVLSVVAMDEPIKEINACEFSIEQAAELNSNYMMEINEALEQGGYPKVEFVLIAAYPTPSYAENTSLKIDEIIQYIELLRENGPYLKGIHLDVDRERLVQNNSDIGSNNFREDMLRLQKYLEEYGVRFGIISWSAKYTSDKEYVDDTMQFVYANANLLRGNSDVVFQSWISDPNAIDIEKKMIPKNLSDSPGDSSHVKLLLDGLDYIGSHATLFDEEFYIRRYSDIDAAIVRGEFVSGLHHYSELGSDAGRQGIFNEEAYLKCNPDVEANMKSDNGWVKSGRHHFLTIGYSKIPQRPLYCDAFPRPTGKKLENLAFPVDGNEVSSIDEEFYKKQLSGELDYSVVAQAPSMHFYTEGYNAMYPSHFPEKSYLACNIDVAKNMEDPSGWVESGRHHYLEIGYTIPRRLFCTTGW